MIISNGLGRTLASAIALSLMVSPAMAKAGDGLQDLVGARAGQAEGTLSARGWAYVTGSNSNSEAQGYWWNASSKDCVRITTRDGRYAAIDEAKAADCNQKSSGNGTGTAVAVAAVGAVALTALLLSRKSKDRSDNNGGYQPEWQRVEVHGLQSGTMKIFANPSKNARVIRGVGSGTVLRNFGCEDYNSESWCEVATVDGRTNGWARDRYLRPTDSGSGGNWGGGNGNGNGNGGNWGGGNGSGNGWGGNYRGLVEVYGLQSGTLKITAGPSKDERVVSRVSAGTRLRSQGCQTVRGENWCQVSTVNGRTQGWARERYLRQR